MLVLLSQTFILSLWSFISFINNRYQCSDVFAWSYSLQKCKKNKAVYTNCIRLDAKIDHLVKYKTDQIALANWICCQSVYLFIFMICCPLVALFLPEHLYNVKIITTAKEKTWRGSGNTLLNKCYVRAETYQIIPTFEHNTETFFNIIISRQCK